jgi:hypothetical protein
MTQSWPGASIYRLSRTGGTRELTGYQSSCQADSGGRYHCVQVPVTRESPTLYAYRKTVDIPVTTAISYQRQWRLQKSAPECTPREGESRELLVAAERVEGHVYGCDEAPGCEDKVL